MSKKSELMNKLESVLSDKLGVDVYNNAVDTDDTLVVFGRLKPMITSDRDLKMAEARALKYIESVLKKCTKEDDWQFRFSRPWVLKNERLAFTWDFTIKGNLEGAIKLLESVEPMKAPLTREQDVPLQTSKPKRGRVRQVSVGALR